MFYQLELYDGKCNCTTKLIEFTSSKHSSPVNGLDVEKKKKRKRKVFHFGNAVREIANEKDVSGQINTIRLNKLRIVYVDAEPHNISSRKIYLTF